MCEHRFDYETNTCVFCNAVRLDFYVKKTQHFAFSVVVNDQLVVTEAPEPFHDDLMYSPGYITISTPYEAHVKDVPKVGTKIILNKKVKER